MNVIVKTERTGFVENGWIGHALGLGEEARINVAVPDPRCVMITVAQDGLPKDTDVFGQWSATIGTSRQAWPISLRRGVRRGCCAGNSTHW
jgi:hypothetical protein